MIISTRPMARIHPIHSMLIARIHPIHSIARIHPILLALTKMCGSAWFHSSTAMSEQGRRRPAYLSTVQSSMAMYDGVISSRSSRVARGGRGGSLPWYAS